MKTARSLRWRVTLFACALLLIGIPCWLVARRETSDSARTRPRHLAKTPGQSSLPKAPPTFANRDEHPAPLSVEEALPPVADATPRASVKLFGAVHWTSGHAIPQAEIEIVGDRVRSTARCNADGEYSTWVPPSIPLTVVAYAGRGKLWGRTKAAFSPPTYRLDLEVRDEASFEILVQDEREQPLVAEIHFSCQYPGSERPTRMPEHPEDFTCDANGLAKIDGLLPTEYDPADPPRTMSDILCMHKLLEGAMEYAVLCRCAGYRDQFVRVALQSGPNALRITMKPMEPPITLSGVVLLPNGAAAPGAGILSAYVRFDSRHRPGYMSRHDSALIETFCGADGSFSLQLSKQCFQFDEHRNLFGKLVLYASFEGLAEASCEVCDLTAGQVIDGLVLTLQDGFLVTGRVTDQDGQSLADAEIEVACREESFSRPVNVRCNSGTDGVFHVRLPGRGIFQISASKDGYKRDFDWESEVDRSEVEVEMPFDNVHLVLRREKE